MLDYTSWHQLFILSVVFFFTYRLVYVIIQLSFIYSLSCYYNIYTVYMHEHLSPFSYTLIGSLFDDPRFARPDIGCFLYCSGGWWDRTYCEELEFFSSWSSVFLFAFILLFFDSLYIIISYHFVSLFIYYHVWMLICDIAVIMIYYSWFL